MTFQNVVLAACRSGGNSSSVPCCEGSFAYGHDRDGILDHRPKSGKTTSLGKREFDLENNKGSARCHGCAVRDRVLPARSSR